MITLVALMLLVALALGAMGLADEQEAVSARRRGRRVGAARLAMLLLVVGLVALPITLDGSDHVLNERMSGPPFGIDAAGWWCGVLAFVTTFGVQLRLEALARRW